MRYLPGLMIGLLFCAPVLAQRGGTVLERDFRLMMEWFPGVYDNQEQVYFEDELGATEDERHGRVRSHFSRADLPWLGEHVFYVQQDQNDDPSDIYRQRIYSFTLDEAEDAIKLKIYTPKDTASLVGAHLDPSKLSGLTEDDLTTLHDGCDVFWKRQSNQFIGYMKEGACRIESSRSGRTLIISDDLVLTPEAIWIRDRAVDADGNYVFGNKANIHHKLRKVNPFSCWVGIRKRDSEDYHFQSGVGLDDGGRMVWLETDEEPPQRYGLKMRNVKWPTGTSRDSRVLYVHEDGNAESAVSYAWGDPAASFLGINLRFLQASCTQQASWAEREVIGARDQGP